jgi:hypothetical protein
MWIFLLLFAANLGLSIRNSYVAGKAWAETKFAGGTPRFATWIAAIVAGAAMTWCIFILLLMLAMTMDFIPGEWGNTGIVVGWCLVPAGLICSGYMIAVRGWATNYRISRSLNFGRTYYGGFSDTYNNYNAADTIGSAFKHIFKPFGKGGGGGKKGNGAAILVLIVIIILALAAGALITATIIQRVAASQPLPRYDEALEEREKKNESAAALEEMTSAKV